MLSLGSGSKVQGMRRANRDSESIDSYDKALKHMIVKGHKNISFKLPHHWHCSDCEFDYMYDYYAS